jgi:hypothetical protein
MQIQLLSDLHLEAHPLFAPEPVSGADVLVLAGDIGSYQEGSLLEGEHFGLEQFSPLPQWGGNHEYDMQDFDAAHARLRRTCDLLGLLWLERETVVMEGVRFVGTTLWSDFDSIADHKGCTDLAERLRMRQKAYRAADFYLSKTGCTRAGTPWLAETVRAQALECHGWLSTELARPFGGPTVAVTHFAPSLRSADPRYGLAAGTAGFCNAYDDLLRYARLWLHGHLHAPSDYTAQGAHADGTPWQCRVVANPLGYARKNEQAFFQPQCCIAV